MKSPLWSVVLAAGSGRRLSGVTGGIPKQFWRPDGSATLVEETLARLQPLCGADRTVIVVGEAQRKHVTHWESDPPRGHVVFQPEDRGTAAGVLFGLVHVLKRAPNAVVVITPSDHCVANTDAFRRGILEALAHVQHQDGVVLFGVEPTAALTDYGWIRLDSAETSARVKPVASFVEKPPADLAQRLLSSGGVWNTMVLVARARALLHLCQKQIPPVTNVFVSFLTLPEKIRDSYLASRYSQMKATDFSRDVLSRAANLLAYTWPSSIGWSDLGTPERLRTWLNPGSVERPRPQPEATGPNALIAAS